MRTRAQHRIGVTLAAAALLGLGAQVRAADGLNLLPTPKSVKVDGGEMPLTAQGRVVASEASLKPLAEILCREILAVTKVRLTVAQGEARPGDIVLKINPQLRAEEEILSVQKRQVIRTRDYAHTIAIADTAVVEGWDYRAVCEGTATLLQALRENGGKWSLPKLSIKDWPHADYTGIMLDCARQDIPIPALKDAVDACRFWKVRYLHLHLAEDGSFVFPLKGFGDVGKFNGSVYGGDIPQVWDRDELVKLVAYADARGVTLVPELEGPGHCSALQSALGGKLGDPGWRILDVANDDIYPILDTVITDICEVFKSSPYFHIGGDEIQFDWYIDRPHVREYIKKNNLRPHDKGGKDDLLQMYVTRLNESVKKNGKKAIFWGGLQGPPLIAALNDCIVYSWYAGAKDAQKAGFTTITVPWEIKVPFNEWNMYNCNGEVLDPKNDRVLGHSRPMWEMSAEELTRSWVNGMAERQERVWGPDTKMDLAEFRAREKLATARMARLTRPIDFAVEAKLSRTEGYVMVSNYTDSMTLTMSVDLPEGCRIRYTLDGTAPTAQSALYEKPVKVTGRVRARAAMFDADGQRVGGYTFSERYNYIGHEVNLTTGKPVKTSGGVNPAEKPEFANDGFVNIDQFWGTIPAPQWWQVDLQNEVKLDRVQVIPYFDGKRYYQYTVEVSGDEKTWTKVVDASKNSTPGTETGYLHKFTPVSCRYVKVTVLKNSDNPAVHLLEVRVYEEGK